VTSLTWFVALEDRELAAAVGTLRTALTGAGLADCGDLQPGSAPAAADAVMIWADHPLGDPVVESLLGLGRPLLLGGPTLDRADPSQGLAEAAGLSPGPRTPAHDVRLRAGRDGLALVPRLLDHSHSGQAHLGAHIHFTDGVLPVDKTADDLQVLLTANLGLAEQPMVTWRPASKVLAWTPGTRPDAISSRVMIRLLALTIRQVLGLPAPGPVRVGLLGYGAIGHEHARAIRHVAGLELTAVCDVSAERIAAARRHAPQLRGHHDAEQLIADPAVDLVVVSTPPSTHASWAMTALDAGKHVVVEKPFAIRTEEADAVLELAQRQQRVAAVYQNRRFDPDHLAVRRAVQSGLVGDLFHLEAFVGGYGHPCNLWHSDAEVSGGAFYDWGAHVLDQLLDLMPGEIEHVTAAEHKLIWLDVTNADHSRVTVRFRTGAEATFIYSDLAAALKPRWYLLGTRGAIIGNWRTERVIARSDIGTLAEDVLAPTDSPPVLDLHAADGSVTRLAIPAPPPYAFHAELADQLQLGLAPTVTGAQSRRVLAVMEAAAESARSHGRPVVPR
jgi:scyllo-inositol 2-dehydrogenase (NADP+)